MLMPIIFYGLGIDILFLQTLLAFKIRLQSTEARSNMADMLDF